MLWRNAPLAVAFSVLLPFQVFAGGMSVTSAGPSTPRPTKPTPTVLQPTHLVTQPQAPVVISVAVTPARPSQTEAVYVDLRGPDGQVRRFPVVNQDAIQSPVIVLHPGQSVNIQWVAAK